MQCRDAVVQDSAQKPRSLSAGLAEVEMRQSFSVSFDGWTYDIN